ncbi:hypothetical protein, partial [Klebsiella quasipneumoniae]
PYPAYEKLKYQIVTQIFVDPRKRSAAGQFLKIAPGQHDEALFSEGFRVIQTCFRYRTHLSAGWRLSPYPAYEKLKYQTVMQISVGPRKRSAAGQFLKIAPGQHDEALVFRGLPGDDKPVFVIVLICLPGGGFRLTRPTKNCNIK